MAGYLDFKWSGNASGYVSNRSGVEVYDVRLSIDGPVVVSGKRDWVKSEPRLPSGHDVPVSRIKVAWAKDGLRPRLVVTYTLGAGQDPYLQSFYLD